MSRIIGWDDQLSFVAGDNYGLALPLGLPSLPPSPPLFIDTSLDERTCKNATSEHGKACCPGALACTREEAARRR